MNAVVVDTCVVSFIMRADPRVELYRSHLRDQTLAISFMTVAEMYEGAYRANWGQKKIRRLETTLRKYLVIPYDNEMAREWARIRVERRQKKIAPKDAWIAATARRHGCALVTHDRDFEGIQDLVVISEPEK